MISTVRRVGLRILLAPGLRRLYRPVLKDVATVFMLHRFADPDLGVSGHSPRSLASCLEWLDREGIAILSLGEVVGRLRSAERLPAGAVCFTVDDAYRDFFEHGLPVFESRECPVTVFVPTGFVDGDCWLWWDRVEHVALRTEREALPHPLSDRRLHLGDSGSRRRAAGEIVRALQRVPEGRRERALEDLARTSGVNLPHEPPDLYRPMTWTQIVQAERRGAEFAPHSVTHPVLANVGEDRLKREVRDSWRRLREKVVDPVPVFGYPVGTSWAFGEREAAAVQDTGLAAAVSAEPGYLSTGHTGGAPFDRWSIPRFALPTEMDAFAQIASGLLRLRERGTWLVPFG